MDLSFITACRQMSLHNVYTALQSKVSVSKVVPVLKYHVMKTYTLIKHHAMNMLGEWIYSPTH